MDKPTYPIDLIAERDAKLKIQSTVIKWWNVNFIYPEEESAIPEEKEIEEMHDVPSQDELTDEQKALIEQANEVFARLEAEKAADEAVKQAEIDAALAAQAEAEKAEHYNATTGAYSGAYGTGEISDETRDLASSIMGEKRAAMDDLISQYAQDE